MSVFPINSYVNHRRCGVCKVLEVSPIPSDPNGPKYYLLQPLYGDDKNNLVRVPFDNPASLRDITSKERILTIISSWPLQKDNLYETDAKKRKLLYESVLAKGDIAAMPPILVGIQQKKDKEGKLNSMDQNFAAKAKPIIYGEIATSLSIPYDEVESFILNYQR